MLNKSYDGIIEFVPGQSDCSITNVKFVQTGGGIASHIGQYTLLNTACLLADGNLGEITGAITAANGDEINYYLPFDGLECEATFPPPCIEGENATLAYIITGGTGRFEGVTGTLEIKGKFVPAGPFSATGTAEITFSKNKD